MPPAVFEDVSHKIIHWLLSQVLLCISTEQHCNGSCHHLCQKRQEMEEKQLYEPGTAITSRCLLQFKSHYFAIDKKKTKKFYTILWLWFRLKSKLFILKNTKRYYIEFKKGKTHTSSTLYTAQIHSLLGKATLIFFLPSVSQCLFCFLRTPCHQTINTTD